MTARCLGGSTRFERRRSPPNVASIVMSEGRGTWLTDSTSSRMLVTFPSGRRYAVESSGRSQKGVRRWLILVVEPVAELSVDERSALERFPLTEREFEVARLVVQGLSNEKIAHNMGISPETVKTHVRSIFEKSGTHSRTEFLAAVLRTK